MQDKSMLTQSFMEIYYLSISFHALRHMSLRHMHQFILSFLQPTFLNNNWSGTESKDFASLKNVVGGYTGRQNSHL